MALASIPKVVLGSIAFAIFWVLAVFPVVPFLPIGRTAGSLLGAMLMVLFRVTTPDQAYEAIDLPILGLLFGTMVVSVFLERADMFKYLGKLLSWKSRGAKDLLFRICLISALSSALFTNDTSCVFLTKFVLKIARQHNLPPLPFLLALASSANIGSSATPIGNPQNLIIAVQSKITFGEFLTGILPAMLVGVVVNALILVSMYWKLLSNHKDEGDASAEVVALKVELSQDCNSCLESSNILNSSLIQDSVVQSPRNQAIASESEIQARNSDASEGMMSDTPSQTRAETGPSKTTEPVDRSRDEYMRPLEEDKKAKWKRILWKSSVYVITLGMLVALLLGLNMSWSAITAALALMVLDFKDATPSLEMVSYSLLVLFCGMFIAVHGFNNTGIPGALWDLMEHYCHVDHAIGIAILALVIIVLSNVASNVPTVLLLGGKVAASAAAISEANEKKAWLILAWVSSVAGNLSLLGSAANLIVCEQARQVPNVAYTLTFLSHLKFGLLSTLIVIAIGLTLIR